ncbi:MAG: YjjG family noncanonical pyrimidine nucleotidase [Paludibacter sp.]
MYKYVFLDLDDTIWDFHVNAKSSLQEIYDNKNFDKHFDSFDQYFEIYAKRNLELWDQYGKGEITKDALSLERFLHPLRQVGVHDEGLALIMGKEYLDLLPTRSALVPNALKILDYLAPKYQLTIVSNGFIEVQYLKLKKCGLEHYFSHVVLSEEAGALKPDKKIFEHALQLNGAKASETIMIGDSYEADIIGAQNAGIDQIYFRYSQSQAKQPATFIIDRLDEIFSIL